MKNNSDNQKNTQILHALQTHLSSMPDEKPESLLPDCKCMDLVRVLVKKGMVPAQQVCLFCKSLHHKPGDKEICPFRGED